jgi:diguanylate cyclase (GGDEF)-like protein
VEPSTRRSAVVVVLSLVVLAALGYLAWKTPTHVLAVGLLVAVPLFGAIFLSTALTALVGILVLAVAAGLAYLTADGGYDDYVLPLAAVVVAVLVAVVSAAVRGRARRREPDGQAGGKGERVPDSLRPEDPVDGDPLTGLLNRRGAIRALGPRNSGADRVLAFLDCDRLGDVNAMQGTEAGDELLRAVAARLRDSLPAPDTLARWEADEFLAVASASAESALPVLERMVAAVSAEPIRTDSGPIDATVSVGAATWPAGQDLEDAFSRAGRALLRAKGAGRGQVVLDAGPAPVGDPVLPDAG